MVDIQRDAGQGKHYAGSPGALSGGMVRFETIVAEAGGKQSGRASPDRVCATSVSRAHQHRTLVRRRLQDPFEFPALDQGDVARNNQRAINALSLAETGCHLDGGGLAPVGVVGNYGKMEMMGQINRKRIAGHDADFWASCPCAQGLEYIEKHGLRQFGPGRLIEQGGEALLRAREVFDRDENHNKSEPAWAALSADINERTWRARSTFSSAVLMIVLAQCTRSPDCFSSSAALASRLSTTRISRNSWYAWATPAIETGKHWAAIKLAAGPETAVLPIIGLTAATGARVCLRASTMPGTARIGPMLVTGLLGASSTTVADMMASITPGAGSAFSIPAKRMELTGS